MKRKLPNPFPLPFTASGHPKFDKGYIYCISGPDHSLCRRVIQQIAQRYIDEYIMSFLRVFDFHGLVPYFSLWRMKPKHLYKRFCSKTDHPQSSSLTLQPENILKLLTHAVENERARFLIIDSIEHIKGRELSKFMKELKLLAMKHHLTIIFSYPGAKKWDPYNPSAKDITEYKKLADKVDMFILPWVSPIFSWFYFAKSEYGLHNKEKSDKFYISYLHDEFSLTWSNLWTVNFPEPNYRLKIPTTTFDHFTNKIVSHN